LSKEETIRLEGEVIELLRGAVFRVMLDEPKHVITAHLSGRLRKNSINILLADRVSVELSTYDLSKGRIIYRL